MPLGSLSCYNAPRILVFKQGADMFIQDLNVEQQQVFLYLARKGH